MNFISSMLSSPTGNISSKRTVMVWFVLLFTLISIVNLFTGKKLDHDIQVQMFEILLTMLGTVFGEAFINGMAARRGQKVTQTSTTVIPEGSTAVTTETTKIPVTAPVVTVEKDVIPIK